MATSGNVYKFPGGKVAQVEAVESAGAAKGEVPVVGSGKARKFFSGCVWVLWLVVSSVWPVLRWVIALDVAYQAVRAAWYWDTPGVLAGWTFAAHFAVLVVLTYFVAAYKPRKV